MRRACSEELKLIALVGCGGSRRGLAVRLPGSAIKDTLWREGLFLMG